MIFCEPCFWEESWSGAWTPSTDASLHGEDAAETTGAFQAGGCFSKCLKSSSDVNRRDPHRISPNTTIFACASLQDFDTCNCCNSNIPTVETINLYLSPFPIFNIPPPVSPHCSACKSVPRLCTHLSSQTPVSGSPVYPLLPMKFNEWSIKLKWRVDLHCDGSFPYSKSLH